MLSDTATDLEALEAIYDYVVQNITYDEVKAETVEAGYLPDVDETLATGTGICFDYAALMTAMLRSRDIPCRLVIGYSGDIKHAWIDVYIRSVGWVDQAISFDGDTWTRMDPTFDANSEQSEDIRNYIGNDENYTVQYIR
jgi:transglutaminase-like putative cysteine protease